ncbi:MAG: hypothetical protein ACOCUH_00305 [Bacteriovoracia bacterium]
MNLAYLILIFLLSFGVCFAQVGVPADIPASLEEKLSIFTGHVSRLNEKAGLMRVRVRFRNMKFLNKKDKVYFWTDLTPSNKCQSYMLSKSDEYILLRIPDYSKCVRKVGITVGAQLYFQSYDMKDTLSVAKQLVEILLKKRLALSSMLTRHKNDVNAYTEKADVVNRRFSILREKLELEWEQELAALEEDKISALKKMQNAQSRLDELNMKLEKYRIHDRNLEIDRWALDVEQYRKK